MVTYVFRDGPLKGIDYRNGSVVEAPELISFDGSPPGVYRKVSFVASFGVAGAPSFSARAEYVFQPRVFVQFGKESTWGTPLPRGQSPLDGMRWEGCPAIPAETTAAVERLIESTKEPPK